MSPQEDVYTQALRTIAASSKVFDRKGKAIERSLSPKSSLVQTLENSHQVVLQASQMFKDIRISNNNKQLKLSQTTHFPAYSAMISQKGNNSPSQFRGKNIMAASKTSEISSGGIAVGNGLQASQKSKNSPVQRY